MDVTTFLSRWLNSAGAERANKDSFLKDLCDVLGVPHPDPKTGDPRADDYVFERDAITPREGETTTTKFIDLYKRGCFVLEAKQGSTAVSPKLGTARRDTPGWTFAMKEAFGQAYGYARTFDLPPPFVIVVDLGHCFELYADFACTGDRPVTPQYAPYPDAQHHRLFVADLPAHVDLLRTVWTDPLSLDPSRRAARVTEEVATHLAELAKSLDLQYPPELVAKFLMRCLFTMFAEDVGLLGDNLFTDSLTRFWLPSPAAFPGGVRSLWRAMNDGGEYVTGKLLRFNGGLFADASALPLTREQIALLLEAARCDWSDVEPAIFGTLLERALNPRERHKLGAHYTPRAYVERLVRPTIIEPLTEQWEAVQVEARALLTEDKPNLKEAVRLVREFHGRLAATRVLDPACGSGNFLYVTLDLFKRLESDVLKLLSDLGESELLEMQAVRVSPRQFLGLELNPWAKEIAELVLWIGYLQWHFRTYAGRVPVQEPIIEDTKSIVCRDAVLAWERIEFVSGDHARPATTKRISARKYGDVARELKTVPIERYLGARPSEWPEADFVVGNPPFIGKSFRRDALGDGYLDALTAAYPGIPAGVDYVMYWWYKAARLVTDGKVKRFGFITTNSIRQSLNRRVVNSALDLLPDFGLLFAVPNHPWVDTESGAAVRISMTVFGRLLERGPTVSEVVDERSVGDGEVAVKLDVQPAVRIHADLRRGIDVGTVSALQANQGICSVGVVLFGQGFVVNAEDAPSFEPEVCRPFLNGRDLMQSSRGSYVIDLFPYDHDEARARFPKAYQRVYDLVRPERASIRDPGSKARWWRFGRDKPELREGLVGLSRYCVTVEVSKHRVFQFVEGAVLPDHRLVVLASEDAYLLGILTSKPHVVWSLATGGTLEDRPCYNRSVCFDPFPFPVTNDAQKIRIRDLAEALDAHRKARLAEHPDLTITGMYNVLERLRATEGQGQALPLQPKERAIHEKALVSVLKSLHDDLDAAVFAAYGWPVDLTDEQILERLVALNAERAREEAGGLIRWLRPDFQNRSVGAIHELPPRSAPVAAEQTDLLPATAPTPATAANGAAAWPQGMLERLAVVRARVTSDARLWAIEDVRASFKGARGAQVEPVLDSLAFLGHLVRVETADGPRWRGAGV